jgi:uncharacterized protein RhaS with RHS repeats
LGGQFTQEDPIGLAGGLNLYGFANGDPINFSDPFGLCPEEQKVNGVCPMLTGTPPLMTPFPLVGGGLRAVQALAVTRSLRIAGAAARFPSQFAKARKVQKAVGGTLRLTQNGGGFRVTIPGGEGGKNVVLRVMGQGGGRTNFFRVSRDGTGTFTEGGVPSSDRALTHISLKGKTAEDLVSLIQKIGGGGG